MQQFSHRDAWRSHERFSTQALLLESHDSFAAAGENFSSRLERIRFGEGLQPRQRLRFASRLEHEFRDWQWAMRCHERYEENKLYPFLSSHFGVDCEALADDHERLHGLGASCEELLARGADELGRGSRDGLDQAASMVEQYRAALVKHLCDEEILVIPLLLSLTRDEFRSYAGSESCSVPSSELAAPGG